MEYTIKRYNIPTDRSFSSHDPFEDEVRKRRKKDIGRAAVQGSVMGLAGLSGKALFDKDVPKGKRGKFVAGMGLAGAGIGGTIGATGSALLMKKRIREDLERYERARNKERFRRQYRKEQDRGILENVLRGLSDAATL